MGFPIRMGLGLGWLVVIVPEEMLLTSELDTDAWCKVVYDRKKENEKKQTRGGNKREEPRTRSRRTRIEGGMVQ